MFYEIVYLIIYKIIYNKYFIAPCQCKQNKKRIDSHMHLNGSRNQPKLLGTDVVLDKLGSFLFIFHLIWTKDYPCENMTRMEPN